MMGRKTNSIESDGLFITKQFDVANKVYDYFIGKLSQEMPKTNSEQSYSCIKKQNERKSL